MELELPGPRGGRGMLDTAGNHGRPDLFTLRANRERRAVVVESGEGPRLAPMGAPVLRGRRFVSS